jgi:general secretion pathway protein L
MSRLRVALPPLATLDADSPVEYAWLGRSGEVEREGQSTLLQLGAAGKIDALECYLHPEDSVVTSMELPLLPAAKISAAVGCAAQALILGSSEHMHVAHSIRDLQGRVQIAWLPLASLQHLGQLLRQAQLKLRGLYPAAYALPVGEEGSAVGLRVGEHLLVRHSVHSALVYPMADETLSDLSAQGTLLQWIGEAPAAMLTNALPATARWTGPAPEWGLHGGIQMTRVARGGWGKALGASALALLVWTVGLNIYAAREAAQGQQLKDALSARVKQAFPELPVILNPLQQARQQIAARQTGAAQDISRVFNHLLQQAGNAMPFMSGRVQALTFADSELQLKLLPDSRKAPDDGWQATLAQAGIAASANSGGWTLRPAPTLAQDSQAAVETSDE